MTKNIKAGIFFINMRVTVKYTLGQAFVFLFALLQIACSVKKDENPVIPPETYPLSRDFIGFGVINLSYTHITEDPSVDSISLGYLRRGSIVRVLRRQAIKTGTGSVSWVFVEGNQRGWLKEDAMSIYDSENRAKTAAESMIQ
jgi:hypothetical protein